MPITAGIVALAGALLVGLSLDRVVLLGALLSPTDPVLTSGIVTDPRVPRLIRHSLNLESGLNDGLALPAVLAFARRARAPTRSDFVWWRFVLQDIGLGFAYGLACGLRRLAADAPRGARRRSRALDPHPTRSRSMPSGVAFATYGVTVLPPRGNGFIAVFVAAIVLGMRRPDLRAALRAARR